MLGTFAANITAFEVHPEGALRPIGVVDGLAPGAGGLVAR